MKSMVHNITLLFSLVLSLSLGAQNNGIIDGHVKFEDTVDIYGEPPDSIKNLSSWFMSNMKSLENDCLDSEGDFYFEIYILSNGRVTKWTLIQENNEGYCAIAEVDAWKVPRWKPASKNGEACNQHFKIKTHIHLK